MKKSDSQGAPFADQRGGAKPDEVGTITIIIQRREGRNYVPGALMRSITVRDTKVSEVHRVLYRALFGRDPEA